MPVPVDFSVKPVILAHQSFMYRVITLVYTRRRLRGPTYGRRKGGI